MKAAAYPVKVRCTRKGMAGRYAKLDGCTAPPRRPLGPGELAEAVVLADVSLALTVVGQVVPFGGALLVAAVVPLAVVAARHRLRAVIAGVIAASAVGFLVIGSAALTSMAACAAFGAAGRRGRPARLESTPHDGARRRVLWPPIALLTDLRLCSSSPICGKLVLDNIRNGWRGLLHLMENLDTALEWIVRTSDASASPCSVSSSWQCGDAGRGSRRATIRRRRPRTKCALRGVAVDRVAARWMCDHHRARTRGRSVGRPTVCGSSLLVVHQRPDRLVLRRRVRRLARARLSTPALRRVRRRSGARGRRVDDVRRATRARAPLPVALRARRTSATRTRQTDALHDVSLERRARRARRDRRRATARASRRSPASLAGRLRADRGNRRTAGRRSGSDGRAAPRSCSSGPRRRCSACASATTSCGACTTRRRSTSTPRSTRVGLRELADRETSTLSGGELQRLAVAAALARGAAAARLRRGDRDGRRRRPARARRAAARPRATTASASCT